MDANGPALAMTTEAIVVLGPPVQTNGEKVLVMVVKRVIPNIRSGNPADGQEFYTDVLGLELVMDMGWIGTFRSPENPTAQLTIVDSDPSQPHPDYSVEVADVEDCYRRTQERMGHLVSSDR
jgi:hypothetical protein